ncbi:MAG: serine/threonine protein kinase [Methylococcaceae bacterium]|nr:serine/threonine protein kinase [Methylococcaceae bacterium]
MNSNDSDDATKVATQPTAFDADATIIAPQKTKTSVVINPLTDHPTHRFSDLESNDNTDPSRDISVGSVLKNRFVLKEILGSGGMGTVFRATDLRREEAQDQQTDVALKVLNKEFRDNPELFIALQRETKKSQLLAHPNIVNVYDFDRDGPTIFMVMEILQGQSLAHFIRTIAPAGGLPFKKAWPIINGLASALAYAHKKNIIHSDFKPGNVFITEDNEVKVLDFGIACAGRTDKRDDDETVFNARDLGALTPAYASLEMLENREPDPRDDIYALACVSYEILSGKHPFGKLSAQKALEVNLQPPVIPGLKRRQWKAITHALAIKKEKRTASIEQFLDEIGPKPLLPRLLAVAAVMGLISAIGGYVYVSQNIDTAPQVIEISPEQKLQIKDLLELAQIHFDVGFLTAPSGSNASWAYRQVLAIDPYNKDAKLGLEKIADSIHKQANELFDQQQFDDSLTKIEEGLEVMPKHEGLLDLKDKISKVRAH